MGLKVQGFYSRVVKLKEWLSIERYYTFIQGKSTPWLYHVEASSSRNCESNERH